MTRLRDLNSLPQFIHCSKSEIFETGKRVILYLGQLN